MDQSEFNRARNLIMQYGWNSTCYQILHPRMQLWFAEKGDAVIGFVTHAGIRVVAGAPVTAHERFVEVALEFEAEARRHHEGVCYFAAEEWFETRWQAYAPKAKVILGAQPVWNPQEWLRGLATNPGLRAQVNRARNKEVVVDSWSVERAEASAELRVILRQWLATRGLPPMHFLVESDTLDHLGDRRVFVASGPGGEQGFLVACPVPARNGWLAELVIRRPTAPNGTAELLINSAALSLAQSGASYFTLGLSPLARMHGANPNPLWLRALLAWLRAHGRRFYHFRGLEYFKSKFNPPVWKPVYALLPGQGVSPLALYAISAAFAGGPPLWMLSRALAGAVGAEARELFSRRLSRHR